MEGWVATAALITAYDTWVMIRNRTQVETELERRRRGSESMSACWRRWLDEPLPRCACAVVWGGLTAHLFIQKGRRT